MNKKAVILIMFLLLNFSCFSQENPQLYSQEYFDYLIECTQPKVIKKEEKTTKEEPVEISKENEIVIEDQEPFKLKIENTAVGKYTQSYIKEDTKSIVPIGKNLNFAQDIVKFKNNKYNSDDVKSTTGLEYKFSDYIKVSSGLETNYKGYNQIPDSQKIYFTPSLSFKDMIFIDFHNKYSARSGAVDHDIGLNVSPLKSKALDVGVYAGMTRNADGDISRSVIFKTSFSFY